MSEKVNPQGQAIETKAIDGVVGIMPTLTTDITNAKVDFTGYLYVEKEVGGVVGRMPVIATDSSNAAVDSSGRIVKYQEVDGVIGIVPVYAVKNDEAKQQEVNLKILYSDAGDYIEFHPQIDTPLPERLDIKVEVEMNGMGGSSFYVEEMTIDAHSTNGYGYGRMHKMSSDEYIKSVAVKETSIPITSVTYGTTYIFIKAEEVDGRILMSAEFVDSDPLNHVLTVEVQTSWKDESEMTGTKEAIIAIQPGNVIGFSELFIPEPYSFAGIEYINIHPMDYEYQYAGSVMFYGSKE